MQPTGSPSRPLAVILLIQLFLSLPASTSAKESPATLINIRHHAYPDHTRIVFDVNQPTNYKTARLPGLQTLSIHLPNMILGEIFQKDRIITVKSGFLKTIEIRQEEAAINVMLTFKNRYFYKISSISDPDRLVIDAFPSNPALKKGDLTPAISKNPPVYSIRTIVIDPGHGGDDPGTIGKSGLTEKAVVLDVSRRLKDLVVRKLKKEVLMTREKDFFLSLEERTLLANGRKADLFISVHANAHPKRSMQGIEIYLLGVATDEQAIATAARENATADGNEVNFQEMILSDLEKEYNLNASLELAHLTEKAFIEKLGRKYATVSLGVKRAPFYVLAKTNMPAILAEISFLSNPLEERRLKNRQYRQRIAEALYTGIDQYIRSSKKKS